MFQFAHTCESISFIFIFLILLQLYFYIKYFHFTDNSHCNSLSAEIQADKKRGCCNLLQQPLFTLKMLARSADHRILGLLTGAATI